MAAGEVANTATVNAETSLGPISSDQSTAKIEVSTASETTKKPGGGLAATGAQVGGTLLLAGGLLTIGVAMTRKRRNDAQ